MRRTAWRSAFVAAAGLLASAAALALPETRPEPSPAVACARVKAGSPLMPEYPFNEYKSGTPGRVQATVALPGGLFGNQVEIQSSEGGAAFEAEVRRWLRTVEAPCLAPGETAVLRYDFVFQPDRREVAPSDPQDAQEAEHDKLLKCMKHVGEAKAPEYPGFALRKQLQGRVMGYLSFGAADQPPQLEMLQRPSAEEFRGAIERWAAGLRLPCHPGGGPLKARVLFVFRIEGDGAFGFKPMRVLDLLGVGKGVRERPLSIDTTQMGCPFDLRLTYLRPERPNLVGEVGQSDPRRRPLLELLRGLELDMRSHTLDAVYADTADVTVPCFRLNLNPQEKKS